MNIVPFFYRLRMCTVFYSQSRLLLDQSKFRYSCQGLPLQKRAAAAYQKFCSWQNGKQTVFPNFAKRRQQTSYSVYSRRTR